MPAQIRDAAGMKKTVLRYANMEHAALLMMVACKMNMQR
jgi:hypothetical protein